MTVFLMKKIEEKILKNEDIFGRNHNLKKISLDNSFPNYILENKDKLKMVDLRIGAPIGVEPITSEPKSGALSS